jgi:uncharacterized metal-binding protein YceD (DUF177 family)
MGFGVRVMTIAAHGWSVPVRLDDISEAGLRIDVAAEGDALPALARAAGVDAVLRLAARFELVRRGHDGVHVSGHVSATVRQTCVVTLEQVENGIEEPVDLTFAPRQDDGETHGREEEIGTRDPPEALVDGNVDLGAIATEFLILGIDPYPRKPGAVFAAPASAEGSDKPFAALAALKKR